MKKPLLFHFVIFLAFALNAQNLSIADTNCLPVPWVNAEILENENDVLITWDVPCDTCNPNRYKIAGINYSICPRDPFDGTNTPLLNTINLNYIYTGGEWYNAFAVRAEYDSCNSDWVFSNNIYYDTVYNNQTFELTVNITLEDGGNPQGTDVTVIGSNYYFEDTTLYQQADLEGIALFDSTMRGCYYVTASKPGYDTAYSEDINLGQDTIIFLILKKATVSIYENQEEDKIKIYPNPAKDRLTLQSTSEIHEVSLVNLVGQTVISVKANKEQNKRIDLNTSCLEDGIYIVEVKTDKEIFNRKVLIHN